MNHLKMDSLLEKLHVEIMTLHNKERQDALMSVWSEMMEDYAVHKDSHNEKPMSEKPMKDNVSHSPSKMPGMKPEK